jgi:DNA repair exonuclease SbcCD ATPase subunit
MSQTELLNKCEAERKYLHKVYEEAKEVSETLQKELDIEHTRYLEEAIKRSDLEEENNKLKEELKTMKKQFNSLMTQEQKDICNGEAMVMGEPTLQTPEDWIERLRMFLEERDTLAQAVEDLEEEEGRLETENKELKADNALYKERIWLNDCELETYKDEVGVSKLVHHQNMGLLEDIKKLKDCNYEEYCELVGGENKLIKEFEDLKNELGELKKEKEEYSKAYTATLKRRNWDASERKKLREEVQYHKETAEVAVGLANKFKAELDELKKV